ncbi:MAG: hypothetical protein SCABRO_03934 [Candidatus Scalindua brodae]|uniref:Uncharacterized protein n=1 Tax=Candidatus Scalindua brodae TaxID=237368 RepID=A0A0B0EAS1_9BACT|nr:MAG: hypothetical protein SCABRO_03934 [Candidatus Scalindua brodae]
MECIIRDDVFKAVTRSLHSKKEDLFLHLKIKPLNSMTLTGKEHLQIMNKKIWFVDSFYLCFSWQSLLLRASDSTDELIAFRSEVLNAS